ncbi:MAG: two-component system response regulator GlrR [Gammaproteobacteria bacterium]|nr:MAG: two-component system response regulator GlrR [Gammaproteobacteria bacterium]
MTEAQAPKILLVDDDPGLLQLLAMRMAALNYDVESVASAELALQSLETNTPAVVVTDLRMEGMSGLGLFEIIQKRWPAIPVIILTAHGSIQEAVYATQQGVFSFLTKPVDKDELASTLQQAVALNRPLAPAKDSLIDQSIITRSPKMYRVIDQARLVAKSDVSVLISGESGTGKELLAQTIHRVSQRADKPFIPINCGAMPEDLLESELFGHKKGAFTGATADSQGLFMAAEGGTLFLDEVGDMPMTLQVKLLRVLQERQIRAVGSTQFHEVDVRVLAATHKDLLQEVEEGRFREDLYYRLNVVNLSLPGLSERQEDIPLLINHYLKVIAERTGQPEKRLAKDALAVMLQYSWPGNVRQLTNVIEQVVALSTSPVVSSQLVEDAVRYQGDSILPLTQAKRQFEKEYVEQLLRTTNGNMSLAAKLAQRNRSDFYKILKRHHLDPDTYKHERKPSEDISDTE